MPLNKALDAIIENDLQSLVTQQDTEGKNLDYKVILSLDAEETKAEFRRDVTAFANALGGDIVVGVRESKDNKGIPEELCGFDIGNLSEEQYKNRLVEILQSRVKPRIQGIGIRVLPLSTQPGKWAAVIRIPKSFARPHQVEVGNKNFEFWFRHEASKQRMDIDEIRSSILSSDTLSERIRSFRIDRLGRIKSGDTPIALVEGTKMVMHLVPLNAFEPTARYELAPLLEGNLAPLSPMYSSLRETQHNFDGIIAHDKWAQESSAGSYVQVFRSGIVESVEGRLFTYEGTSLDGDYFDKMLFAALPKYLSIQQKLAINPPILVMLSLLNISGYDLSVSNRAYRSYPQKIIHENDLLVPEEVIEDYTQDSKKVAQSIIDRIWNAAGWPHSMSNSRSR